MDYLSENAFFEHSLEHSQQDKTSQREQERVISRSLLSFSEKITQVHSLEAWLLFLASKIPKKLKTGELILFFESKQFGLRRSYIRRSIFFEELSQSHWPVKAQMDFSSRDENSYLTQEMGRPFFKTLAVPFKTPESAKTHQKHVLFVEILQAGKKEQELKDFFSERMEVLNLTLNRILQNNSARSSFSLWQNVFGKWNEPLAILHKSKVLKANTSFKELLKNNPDILELKHRQESFLDIDGATYCVHYYPISQEQNLKDTGIFYFENMNEQFDLKERFFRSEKMAALYDLGKNMAHELNNPLTGICSMSQILSQDEGLKDFYEDFEELKNATARCQQIIEKLLTFAQFKKQESLNCSICEVVEDTLSLLSLVTSGISVQYNFPEKDIKVLGDFSVFQQVLYNLIVNASQALKSFKEQKNPEIEIEIEQTFNQVLLKVRDNGPGIPKENLEKIFQLLWTTKKQGTGTGLGLGIARYMLNHLGASISVTSEVGKGACFTVSIPKG